MEKYLINALNKNHMLELRREIKSIEQHFQPQIFFFIDQRRKKHVLPNPYVHALLQSTVIIFKERIA